MSGVFLRGFGEDQDIVQVDKNKLVDHFPENIIHQALEDDRSVSKWHQQVFPVFCWGIECCLPLIPLSNAHQVVGVVEVQLGEEGGTLQEFKGGRHQGKRVPVLDGDVIDRTIVNARTQGPVLLPHEEEPCGEEEGRMRYFSLR